MTVSPLQFIFTSELQANADDVWAWAVSRAGISQELSPIARMTMPAGLARITDVEVVLGRPLFASWILLFGVLPIDRSELTLIELEPGRRFLEQSPMLSMKLWRHERIIEPTANGCRLTDRLQFEPRFATPVAKWFIRTMFTHRHAVLRCSFTENS